MKKSSLSIAAYLALVFVSGLLVGILSHQLYTARTVNASAARTPDDVRRQFINEMQTRVGIRSDQLPQLNAVLDVSRAKYQHMRAKIDPEVRDIREEQARSIKAFLTTDQIAKYNQLLEEKERERLAREKTR